MIYKSWSLLPQESCAPTVQVAAGKPANIAQVPSYEETFRKSVVSQSRCVK